MAVILAGGEGERLSILSGAREAGRPFGGKYRIIDFTLSNCVNSDIDDVVVLTQYNPRSLNDHIGLGRPWDLDRNPGGVKLLQPYIARGGVAEWYRGTADAVLRNLNVIEHADGDTIVVLAGDHIYKMDYQPFVAAHRRKRADVTIAVRRVPLAEASRMGILALDETTASSSGRRSPSSPRATSPRWASTSSPRRRSGAGCRRTASTSGRNVIPAMLDAGARVFGYRYVGYWQDVGTIQSFWEANMALLADDPELDLYDKDWVIHTRSEDGHRPRSGRPPRSIAASISHGCVIDGTVVNSVLSPGVRVGVGAVVRDSIVMFDSVIRSGAVVDRAILDKEVVVGQGAIVGDGPYDDTPNKQEPNRLNTGITVVGKRAVVPRGTRIGRNVQVAADIRSSDFVKKVIKSGESVDAKPGTRSARRAVAARARPSRHAAGARVIGRVGAAARAKGGLPRTEPPRRGRGASAARARHLG